MTLLQLIDIFWWEICATKTHEQDEYRRLYALMESKKITEEECLLSMRRMHSDLYYWQRSNRS